MSEVKRFNGVLTLFGAVIGSMLFLNGVKIVFDPDSQALDWENGRRSNNIEDQRSNGDTTASNTPIESIPSSPSPSPEASPLPSEVETGKPLGIIQRTGKGYQGWNLRLCPSLSPSCVDVSFYADTNEAVELLLDDQSNPIKAYNDGLWWYQVHSMRFNRNGWIASNGLSIVQK